MLPRVYQKTSKEGELVLVYCDHRLFNYCEVDILNLLSHSQVRGFWKSFRLSGTERSLTRRAVSVSNRKSNRKEVSQPHPYIPCPRQENNPSPWCCAGSWWTGDSIWVSPENRGFFWDFHSCL